MYRVLYSLAAVLIVGCTGPAMTAGINDGPAPIKSSVIVIKSSYSESELYRSVGQTLTLEGFVLGNTDRDMGVIASNRKDVGGSTFVQLSIIIGPDGEVRVQGNFSNSAIDAAVGLGDSQSPIEKTGMNGSPARNAWAAMHSFAEKVASAVQGSISYR